MRKVNYTCMLSLFTAMDIIISIKWVARVEKRSTCKGGKNIK